MKSLFLVLCLCLVAAARADEPVQYRYLSEIPIGGEGGWDFPSIDPVARRLYLAQSTRVVEVDLRDERLIGEVGDTPGVHGIAIAHRYNRGYISVGKEGKIAIADFATMKVTSKVPAGQNPDAILFDPGTLEVDAFNGRSDSVTVIRALTGAPVATIPLPGKPEFAVVDPKEHRIFVNIEDKSLIAAIDTSSHVVVSSWPLAPCEEPTGLAIDLEHHRLFAGCSNGLMVMVDGKSGKVLSSIPIGNGVDATAYDPDTRLVFASCGEGSVTVAKVSSNKLELVQRLTTQKGARTMALDPVTHRIYLPTSEFEPEPSPPAAGKGPHHAKVKKGTLKILVYGISGFLKHKAGG